MGILAARAKILGMSSPPRRSSVTAEQLYELPDDGKHYELLRGTLVSEPRPSFVHGRIVTRVAKLLSNFVDPARLGVVVSGDPGFLLARHPDTVRGPDVAFVSAERVRQLDPTRPFFPGSPDLAVEVLSPSDRTREVLGKVADYLAAGSRVVWVVDPAFEEVSVFRAPFQPRVLSGQDVLDCDDLLPGFSVEVTKIFEA